MKKTLLLLILFLAFASRVFAAEGENANTYDSFKTYCGIEMAKVLETYKGEQYSIVHKSKSNKPERWVKTSEKVDPSVGIEMQKATVPGGPDTGVLIVKQSTAIYADNFDSAEKAKAETNVVDTVKNMYKFYMSYENNEWVLKKVMRYTHWQKKWHTVSPTSVFDILQSKNEVKQ
ncbi:MAG: hypothetical protein U2P59_10045 [Synergistota bacterium]|nr:hypothetical protein [Synergistota bacterium]